MDKRLARFPLIVLICGYSTLSRSDTMISARTDITDSADNPQVQNPTTTRTIKYRHGSLRRRDSLDTGTTPSMEDLVTCETRTGFIIDLSAREYRGYKVVNFLSEAQRREYLEKTGRTAVELDSQTLDTGERKAVLGYQAKRLTTTTKRRDGKDPNEEEILDGWYIDHETPDLNCAPDFVRSEEYYLIGTALVIYPDVAHFNHIGPLPKGLAVSLKMTHRFATNKEGIADRTITVEETVEDISDLPLSPSLFELPNGLHENPQLLGGRAVPKRWADRIVMNTSFLLEVVAAMGVVALATIWLVKRFVHRPLPRAKTG